MQAQASAKHTYAQYPIMGINHFSCEYGSRQKCGGALSVAIDPDTWAEIKTLGARVFTPICPQCKQRTMVHIG
jgi:hypothetical protein